MIHVQADDSKVFLLTRLPHSIVSTAFKFGKFLAVITLWMTNGTHEIAVFAFLQGDPFAIGLLTKLVRSKIRWEFLFRYCHHPYFSHAQPRPRIFKEPALALTSKAEIDIKYFDRWFRTDTFG